MSASGSGDDDDHPERSDSSGDYTRRRRSKGPSDSGSDPAAGYEDSLNSADVDDAQQTLSEIESNIEATETEDSETVGDTGDETDQTADTGGGAGGVAPAGVGDAEPADPTAESTTLKTLANIDVDDPNQMVGGIAAAIDDERDDFHDIQNAVLDADTVGEAEDIIQERLTPVEVDAAVTEIELQEQMRQDYKPVIDIDDLEVGQEVLYDADVPKRGVVEEIGADAWMDEANRDRTSPIEFAGEVYVEPSDGGETDSEIGLDPRLDTSKDAVFTASQLQQSDVVDNIDDELNAVGSDEIRALAADDLTPDAPEGANLDNATRFKSMELSSDGVSGASFGALWKTEAPDGTVTYTTFTQVGANPLAMTEAAKTLDKTLSEEGKQRAGFPELYVDSERGAAVLGEAGAPDATGAGSYDPDTTQAEFSKRDYVDSVAAKMLLGDTDIGGNVAASSSGKFRPIDYDLGGDDLAEKDEELANDDNFYAYYDGVLDRAQSECRSAVKNFDFEVTEDDLRQSLHSLAREVDLDSFESQLEATTYISDELKSNMVNNIKTAREREL